MELWYVTQFIQIMPCTSYNLHDVIPMLSYQHCNFLFSIARSMCMLFEGLNGSKSM